MFKLSVIVERRACGRFAAAPWLGTQQGDITNQNSVPLETLPNYGKLRSRHFAPKEAQPTALKCPDALIPKTELSEPSQRMTVTENQTLPLWPNDPSSATRPTGRVDCNRDAHAGFAAAHG